MITDKYKTIGEVIDIPDPTFESEITGMSVGELSNLNFMLKQEYQRSIIVQSDLTSRMESLNSDTSEFNKLKDLSLSLYSKMQSIENKEQIIDKRIRSLDLK